jgi:hypothetical protein
VRAPAVLQSPVSRCGACTGLDLETDDDNVAEALQAHCVRCGDVRSRTRNDRLATTRLDQHHREPGGVADDCDISQIDSRPARASQGQTGVDVIAHLLDESTPEPEACRQHRHVRRLATLHLDILQRLRRALRRPVKHQVGSTLLLPTDMTTGASTADLYPATIVEPYTAAAQRDLTTRPSGAGCRLRCVPPAPAPAHTRIRPLDLPGPGSRWQVVVSVAGGHDARWGWKLSRSSAGVRPRM